MGGLQELVQQAYMKLVLSQGVRKGVVLARARVAGRPLGVGRRSSDERVRSRLGLHDDNAESIDDDVIELRRHGTAAAAGADEYVV